MMKNSYRSFIRLCVVSSFAAVLGGAVGAGPTLAAEEPAKEHVIEIRNFKFSPARITVRPGDKVTWLNRDIVPHTATADDKSWDTGSLANNRSESVLMTGNIRAAYFCRFHPKMTAEFEIIVQ